MAGYFAGCTGYTYAYGSGIKGLTFAAWALPGGTGNIFPSEYGVHNYDENSSKAGVSATVFHKDYVIDDVSLNDTFESWRRKTNEEIIEKLNLLHVYGATPGDGIMTALGTGGTLAIAFSGNIMRTHSTFCNNVTVGKTLKVADNYIGSESKSGGITVGFNVKEGIVVLNHDESPAIGCDYAGIIIGGNATGGRAASIHKTGADDDLDAFQFDRPYLLNRDGMWRTKEGIWLEGRLNHQAVYTGTTAAGSTGPEYPHGPYGYTGCSADISNPYAFGPQGEHGVCGGVVRIYFGPTLGGENFLDIDGRNGRIGVTGDAWRGPGGMTGALVIGNTAGGLLEFENDGFVNIYKGANKRRVTKQNHGFKFGNVLRYSGTTQGFTFASAAGQSEPHGDFTRAAEVVGMISKVINADTFDLTFVGEVEGTKAQWNATLLENHTEGLVPGNVYFLSTSIATSDRGKIQHAEPIVAGNVNKPVLIATDNTSGILLPYRGQYNAPTGCTGNGGNSQSGASGDEMIHFDIAYLPDAQTFNEGDLVSTASTGQFSSGIRLADSRNLDSSQVIGMVTLVDSTQGFIRIATHGAITLLEKTLCCGAGAYYLHENGQAIDVPSGNYAVKVFDAISPSRVILNIDQPVSGMGSAEGAGTFRERGSNESIPGRFLRLLGPTGATGYTYDNAIRVNENHILNANFGIWQRGIGLTSANRAGSTGYTGTVHTHFADRWLRSSQCGTGPHSGNPLTGNSAGTHRVLDFKLERGIFDKSQTEVEGHPDFYAIIRGKIEYPGGTNSNEWHRVEQRIPDVTSFAGEVMSVSFYARGAATGDCSVAWLQNLTGTTGAAPGATFGGNYDSGSNTSLSADSRKTVEQRGLTASEFVTPITDFRVGTGWQRYNFAFFVPEISNAAGASGSVHEIIRGVSADHFASLAFYTQWTSTPEGEHKNINFINDLHLAQVKLERGNVSTPFNKIDFYEELRRCQRFYTHSYEYGEFPGNNTMRINESVPKTSGVHFIVPGTFLHVHEFPVPMRKKPSCGAYSPSGIPNEGFNRDAAKEMRNVSGTSSSLGEKRFASGNTESIGVTADSTNAIEIRVFSGAAKIDTVTVHYFADAEYNNALPSNVDRWTLGKGG